MRAPKHVLTLKRRWPALTFVQGRRGGHWAVLDGSGRRLASVSCTPADADTCVQVVDRLLRARAS